VPHANLANLDPVWSTQVISRIHGFLVYDTLYGADADLHPRPQMAEGHAFEVTKSRYYSFDLRQIRL
jgi:peptide/nickel transport system substrate-binding protein